MREIKFRIWNGADIYEPFELVELFGIGSNYVQVQTRNEDGDKVLADGYEIMQYTGLKDKNGKEIYEGDVVNFEGITNYEIKFIRGGFAVDFKDGHRYLGQFANPEIIGNIYENTELLSANMSKE